MSVAASHSNPDTFAAKWITTINAMMFTTVHARFAAIGARVANGHMIIAFIGGK